MLRDDLDAYLLQRWDKNKKADVANISLYFTPKDRDAL